MKETGYPDLEYLRMDEPGFDVSCLTGLNVRSRFRNFFFARILKEITTKQK
jgi:hypothetical protein